MIIYTDLLTGVELMSDTYPLKEIDDVAYEIDCEFVPKGVGNIDIGANASKEGVDADDGAADSGPVMVNNVIDGFRLQELPQFGKKKEWADMLKSYVKRVTEKMKAQGVDEAKIKAFDEGVKKYAMKKLAPKLDSFQIFVGDREIEEDFSETMIVYLNYREDGSTPYFTMWKHGLSEMKV